ncbi:hypothetical protein TB2_034531 [Malus domestica]
MRALPSRAQASHLRTPHAEQPTPMAQSTFVVFQAAQIGPRLVQPSWLQISKSTIKLGAFSPHFSTDLTFPNSNLTLGVYHLSTAQGDTFLPSSSNPNGEQHLSRQVIKLTNALVQRMTLVNQLLQCTEMQRAPFKESQSRIRADEEPHQQRPNKQPLGQTRTKRSDSVHSRLSLRDSIYSRLSLQKRVHSRLGPQTSIHSQLRSHFNSQHEQPSRQNVYWRLSPQGASSTSYRST